MPDNGSPSERGLDRSTKALGRGLEEISHLFLSPPGKTAARQPVDDLAPEQPAGRPPARAGVAVLRPGTDLPKDQLTATLLECQDALEGGMRAFGAAVSCSPYGEIDLLAMDCLNQVTVIDVDTTLGDSLLLRGISHVDWVTRNLTNLRRMYQKWQIDFSGQPRLVLVAPRFSPFMTSAIRQLNGPKVACFRYHTIATFGGSGILIERLSGEDT